MEAGVKSFSQPRSSERRPRRRSQAYCCRFDLIIPLTSLGLLYIPQPPEGHQRATRGPKSINARKAGLLRRSRTRGLHLNSRDALQCKDQVSRVSNDEKQLIKCGSAHTDYSSSSFVKNRITLRLKGRRFGHVTHASRPYRRLVNIRRWRHRMSLQRDV